MVSQMTRLAFCGNGSRESTPGAAGRPVRPSSVASATAPSPRLALPRKERRWIRRGSMGVRR
jgi:hypothetical protein